MVLAALAHQTSRHLSHRRGGNRAFEFGDAGSVAIIIKELAGFALFEMVRRIGAGGRGGHAVCNTLRVSIRYRVGVVLTLDAAQADDHIDRGDFDPLRGVGHAGDHQLVGGGV